MWRKYVANFLKNAANGAGRQRSMFGARFRRSKKFPPSGD
jgi:hypothetical protein